MNTAIPMDPEQREIWGQDLAAYQVSERVHRAAEELIAAVYEQDDATGRLFSAMQEPVRAALREKGAPLPTMRLLDAARERVKSAKAEWTAVLADADALLYRRQQGGA